MHEIRKKENLAIQKIIFASSYFSDEFIETMNDDDIDALRICLIHGYIVFKENDVMDQNCQRIMKKFALMTGHGMPTIRHA